MGEQMGLQGLHIPEEFGGSGYGYVELGIVLEEMGRSLLCAPFFSTVVLAANALLLRVTTRQAGSPARHCGWHHQGHRCLHRAERQVGRIGHRSNR